MLADQGFSDECRRRVQRRRGIPHVLPERFDERFDQSARRARHPGRKRACDAEAYKRCNIVERCLNQLKPPCARHPPREDRHCLPCPRAPGVPYALAATMIRQTLPNADGEVCPTAPATVGAAFGPRRGPGMHRCRSLRRGVAASAHDPSCDPCASARAGSKAPSPLSARPGPFWAWRRGDRQRLVPVVCGTHSKTVGWGFESLRPCLDYQWSLEVECSAETPSVPPGAFAAAVEEVLQGATLGTARIEATARSRSAQATVRVQVGWE
ncbi:MAG: hypothetical protein ACRDJN_30255 [Chloroflexota bacterium]